ncbi:acyltransferase [Paenibacillus septentrionalis]|uniref:Acyltransferase n=1 Tax=Paenibacillus septentrionalis TaxID=429342 RepID=A0ABW1V4T1_9BACL
MIKRVLWIIKITFLSIVESFLNFLPEGAYGDLARGYFLGLQLKQKGKKLKVSRYVKVLHPKKLVVGDNVYLGYGAWVNAQYGVSISSNTMLGPYVVIASSNHEFCKTDMSFFSKSQGNHISIGEGSWLGTRVVVTSNGCIGNYCLIAANATITRNIPDNSKVILQNQIIGKVYE